MPRELTGYKLLSELLRDMPSDEELIRLFIERGSIRGGKRELAPTNRDLQLLQMKVQKQSYDSIGETMGMDPKEVRHQISLVLRRISRDLQIELDIPELYKPRMPSPQPEQVKDPVSSRIASERFGSFTSRAKIDRKSLNYLESAIAWWQIIFVMWNDGSVNMTIIVLWRKGTKSPCLFL